MAHDPMNVRSTLSGQHGVAVVHVLDQLLLAVGRWGRAPHQAKKVRRLGHPAFGPGPAIGGLGNRLGICPLEVAGQQRDLRRVSLLLSQRVGAVAQAQFRYDLDQPRIGRLRRLLPVGCREWGCLCEDWIVAGVHCFGPSVDRFPCRN